MPNGKRFRSSEFEICTVVDWGREISAVPEPVNVALGFLGAGFVLVQMGRSARVKKWMHNATHR